MKLLRELAAGLLKMFVGDIWLAIGILLVVSLAGALTRWGSVTPLVAGSMLLAGCILVLIANTALSARRDPSR